MARQIQVTKDFVNRVRKRMPAADEKIRLAQVALQEAMDEKDDDIRELPLAEARLERLQAPHLQHSISKPRFQGCVHC